MVAKQNQLSAFASFFAALRGKRVSRKGTKEDAKALRSSKLLFYIISAGHYRRVVSIKFARKEQADYRFDPSPVC